LGKRRKSSRTLPLDCVVLDLETTGLQPREGARVIEIGAVRLVHGRIVEEFESLLNPGFDLPEIAAQITGITDAELRSAPGAETVIPRLLAFIGKGPVVAHNAAFEQEFIASECQCVGLLPPLFEYHCSLRLARRTVETSPNCKLETLAQTLGLPAPDGFHRALKDARITAHLWVYLCNLIESQRAQRSMY